MRHLGGIAIVTAVAAALIAPAAASGAVQLQPIRDGDDFQEPVAVTSDPTDWSRLLVVEIPGVVKLVRGDRITTFLDLTSRVQHGANGFDEDGLTSIAFAPDFAASRHMYVAYTGSEDTATADPGYMHVDRLTVNAGGDGVVPGSRREILIVPYANDFQTYHYGGQLQVGPDGRLYLSTGDGGPQEDPGNRAQDLGDLRGKLLRIDPGAGGGHSIPADNPFVGVPGARPEIWSLGFRNPWRFSFDPSTGALVIPDVGHNSREEINFEPPSAGAGRGMNFGWNCREGTLVTDFGHGPCDGSYRDPVLEYSHDVGCASIGGYVVRDPGLEELAGRYLYGDYCSGEIRSAALERPEVTDDRFELGVGPFGLSTFGEDACGRVYVAEFSGPVYRLRDSTPTAAAQCPPLPPSPRAPEPADTRAPAVELGGERRQRLRRRGKIAVRFTSDEDATLAVEGEVGSWKPRRRRGGARSYALPPHELAVHAGVEARVVWKLGRRRATRLARKLDRGVRIRASLAYSATDAAGNPAQGERTVRLTRR